MAGTRTVSTKERILDTAEALFAKKGFGPTSLRDITAEAGVNLAAVNYHFQSKDALIHAVFARLVGPINEERLAKLAALEAEAAGRPLAVEDLVRAFIEPVVRLLKKPEGANCARLFGRMFIDPGEYFNKFFRDQLSPAAVRFMAAMRRTLPDVSETEIYWRFLFAVGAVGHTLAGLHHIHVISGGVCDASDVNGLLERLVNYVAAGFRAPVVAGKGEASCNVVR